MSFCVECGLTVKTYQGLCPKCFGERRRLIEPPETIDVLRCTGCERLRIGKSWVKSEVKDAVLPLLEREVSTSKEITSRTFTYDVKEEDERNLLLTVNVVLRVDDFEVVDSFVTRIRVQGGTCSTCGKRMGFYYEAILQVRAENRNLSEIEEQEITSFVEERVERTSTGNAFISKLENVRGGVDFYLSSHDLGKNLAKEIKAMHGGKVSVSPRLYGQKDGKEVYRTTHLIRLPRYVLGDVVRYGGRMYEVLGLGLKPMLRDLKTGERRSVKQGDLNKVKILISTTFEGEVTMVTDKAIELRAHDDPKISRVPRPSDFEETGNVRVVNIGDESYVSMVRRKDPSPKD